MTILAKLSVQDPAAILCANVGRCGNTRGGLLLDLGPTRTDPLGLHE